MIKFPFHVISDTHFYHDNIVKYCMRPGFKDYGNHDYNRHNEIMIDNWIERIGPNDRILHLGDIAFVNQYTKQDVTDLFNDLPGDKYLIKGNHDTKTKSFYESLSFTVIEPFTMKWKGHNFSFSHYPKKHLKAKEINIHGHIHNNAIGFATKRHKNVSVEVISFSPQPIELIMDGCIYRANEDNSRDMSPEDIE